MGPDDNAAEFLLERAAIREFLGGMPRYEAEDLAMADTRRWCAHTGNAEPGAGYMTLAELAEALDTSRLAVRLTVVETGRLKVVGSVEGEPAFGREEARRYVQEARRLAQF